MKTKRMSLYIVSVILLIIMIVGTLGVATWALLSTKLEVGGNIGFTGTGDVMATVSKGTVSGGSITNTDPMQSLTIREEGVTVGDAESWKSLQLAFDSAGNDVTLSFSIKNDQPTGAKWDLQVDLATEIELAGNISATVTAVGKSSANSVKIAPQASVTYNIVFSVAEGTNAVTNADFGWLFNMVNVKNANVEPFQYKLLDDGTYEISAGEDCEGSIFIPATYNGKNVTKIAENGFKGCTGLTAVYIPSDFWGRTLTIGDNAFAGCTNLETLEIEVPEFDCYIDVGINAFDEAVTTVKILGASGPTAPVGIPGMESGSSRYINADPPANASLLNGKNWTVGYLSPPEIILSLPE